MRAFEMWWEQRDKNIPLDDEDYYPVGEGWRSALERVSQWLMDSNYPVDDIVACDLQAFLDKELEDSE